MLSVNMRLLYSISLMSIFFKKYWVWYTIIDKIEQHDLSLVLQPLHQIFVYYKSSERNLSRKEEFVLRILTGTLARFFFSLSFPWHEDHNTVLHRNGNKGISLNNPPCYFSNMEKQKFESYKKDLYFSTKLFIFIFLIYIYFYNYLRFLTQITTIYFYYRTLWQTQCYVFTKPFFMFLFPRHTASDTSQPSQSGWDM